MQKATLDALIARKMQAKADKMAIKEIEVPVLGMSVTVLRLPLNAVTNIVDTYATGELTLTKKLELYKELIYKSVPLFQDSKLQDAYECIEPIDIVTKLLDDNIQAIGALGDEISQMYGLGTEQTINELKN